MQSRSTFGHFVVVCIVVSIFNLSSVNAQTTTNLSASLSSNATTCPAVATCMNNTACNACMSILQPQLRAAESPTGGPNEFVDRGINEEEFFVHLVSEACFTTNDTMQILVQLALDEILSDNRSVACEGQIEPVSDPCLAVELECAMNASCRQCLRDLFASPNNHSGVLRSVSCITAGTILNDLSSNCFVLPRCTYAKQQCEEDPSHNCSSCLLMLYDGRAMDAALQCQTSSLLDNVVSECLFFEEPSCQFAHARCHEDVICRTCLPVFSAQTARGIAEAFLDSTFCTSSLGNASNTASRLLLGHLFAPACGPLTFDPCQVTTSLCILNPESGNINMACASCLGGTYSERSNSSCENILSQGPYTIASACSPCSDSVFVNNRIVLATSIVGGLSILPCIGVILIIVAYGKDLLFIRARIIIGLMLSNIVYSMGCAIPVAMLKTDPNLCGHFALSFATIRFGRAWWFAGKYALVFFELFILSVSIYALWRGLGNLGRRGEAALHAACALGGICAFIIFLLRSAAISADGYNAATQTEAQFGSYSRLSIDDDIDDTDPDSIAAQRFQSSRTEYDSLVQGMLLVWVVFLGVAILLWLCLRWMFATLSTQWRLLLVEAEEQWDRDLCSPDYEGVRRTKRRLLELTKEHYDDLALPMEPFVAVFVTFGIPACVMATNYCKDESQVTVHLSTGPWDTTVGQCDVICELVLAFRSLATVLVYFYPRENRVELFHVRVMWRRLRTRVAGWFLSSQRRHSSGVRFHNHAMIKEIVILPEDNVDGHTDADLSTDLGSSVRYQLMSTEDDVELSET